MIIIGITGTIGAGKGTIVEFLVNNLGFKHYSVRDYLTEILKNRKVAIDREKLVDLGNELRKKYGSSYIVEQLYDKARKESDKAIIESLRTLGEIEALRKKGKFYLFAVDAKPRIRYKRVIKRASATDKISFSKFNDDEEKEMVSNDPSKQNLANCILLADYKFDNNGTLQELHEKITKAIKEIENQDN